MCINGAFTICRFADVIPGLVPGTHRAKTFGNSFFARWVPAINAGMTPVMRCWRGGGDRDKARRRGYKLAQKTESLSLQNRVPDASAHAV